MRQTVIAVMAALALATSACASDGLPGRAATAAEPSRPAVAVTRDGDAWTATYDLDRDAPVWAFFRSALIDGSRRPWRLEQWRVVTPGVVLERAGTRDIL
ncbi:MAG: hypothetical protein ACXW3O_09105, partial [Brevundimonas sp.]